MARSVHTLLTPATPSFLPVSRLLPALLTALLATLLTTGCNTGANDPETELVDLPSQTPLEARNHSALTSSREVREFVELLALGSDRITLDTIGTSIEGRAIPALQISLGEFGSNRDERVLLLAFAQQHGNEPSGKEGALAFALEAARGDHDDLLERVDVLLVPQVNPDGADIHQRRNAANVDLNRSWLIRDGHEVEYLWDLFDRWEPEVTVDVHEYYPVSGAWLSRGWLRLFDMQIGLPTNLNTDPRIRSLAEDGFLAFAQEELDTAGFTSHNYIVGSPDGLRWSTTNANDGRQGLGITNTLSFIFEGKRSEPLATDMERRAEAQRLALESLVRFSARQRDDIFRAVRGARDDLLGGRVDEFVLTMSRHKGEGPLEIPVELTEQVDGDWVVTDTAVVAIDEWYPNIEVHQTTSLPEGWLLPADVDVELMELLEAHGLPLQILDEGIELEVETVTTTGFESHDFESAIALPVTVRTPGTLTTMGGERFVPAHHLRGLQAATLLEADSMHGLLRHARYSSWGEEGDWPILRAMRTP